MVCSADCSTRGTDPHRGALVLRANNQVVAAERHVRQNAILRKGQFLLLSQTPPLSPHHSSPADDFPCLCRRERRVRKSLYYSAKNRLRSASPYSRPAWSARERVRKARTHGGRRFSSGKSQAQEVGRNVRLCVHQETRPRVLDYRAVARFKHSISSIYELAGSLSVHTRYLEL